MTEAQEKKSRRIALITSLGAHGILLFILLLIVAWRAPNPPLPEFGIELNFGMDSRGSGPVQPETLVGSVEEQTPEEVEVVDDLPAPVEEVADEPVEEPVESVQPEVTARTESPVVVEEKKEVKPAEKPKEPVEKKPEPKPEVKEVPKAVYKPKSTEGNPGDKPGAPGSQGDDVNAAGDKGDPQGNIDAKALYGKQGGGGGGVSMTGFGTFGYPDINTPQLPGESNGLYEFKVHVDQEGYVTRVETVQRGLSVEAERRLKATIQSLRFIPKGNPQAAEGRITFKVVSE